jgi:hypothetical protein
MEFEGFRCPATGRPPSHHDRPPRGETALEAVQNGAYDYITKPVNLEDVRIKVERAMRMKRVEKSLKTVSGLFWALIISIPVWLVLGIVLGIVWKRF